MSLLMDAPFSSVTTYRKGYTKKTADRYPPATCEPEYKNPLTGPVEEHILPYFHYKKLPKDQTRYPHPGEYAELLAEKYPPTRIFLRDPPGGPPDLDTIDKFYANENRSVYMVSYCRLGDYESKVKRKETTFTLPEGWIVPLTTQRCGYRDPLIYSESKTPPKIEIHFPKNNLTPNVRVNEVLGVTTGESVYMADISNTGNEIIKGKLHGDVNVRPVFDQEELLRAKLIKRS